MKVILSMISALLLAGCASPQARNAKFSDIPGVTSKPLRASAPVKQRRYIVSCPKCKLESKLVPTVDSCNGGRSAPGMNIEWHALHFHCSCGNEFDSTAEVPVPRPVAVAVIPE